jgi:cytochrome c-type protein NapB
VHSPQVILEPELKHEESKIKTTMMAMLVAGVMTIAYGALQAAEGTLVDDQMGLSKTSVFDNPSPDAFQYPETDPYDAHPLPRAYSGAPPQIAHGIEDLLPITAQKNRCTSCHDKPAMIGKKRNESLPTPMPASHYVKAMDGKLTRSNARYVCTQCHVPQAEVRDLVGNTFTH